MSSPDQEHKSDTTSLDAERARLRSAGYTDAEVSQILIARASQQPAGTGQGVMSNVLSSILGVASHARALIPTFRKDVATLFDGAATASARAGAMASLAVKAIVVIVLGYAAWQEWQQHIISATTTAQYQAIRSKADACLAMTDTAGKTLRGDRSFEASARVQAQIDAVCQEVWNLPPAVFTEHDTHGLLQTIVPQAEVNRRAQATAPEAAAPTDPQVAETPADIRQTLAWQRAVDEAAAHPFRYFWTDLWHGEKYILGFMLLVCVPAFLWQRRQVRRRRAAK
jgi:hypothetical protein